MDTTHALSREWIETDGLGGFASGTISGIRTRRYHALLLASAAPPTNRFVLVKPRCGTSSTGSSTQLPAKAGSPTGRLTTSKCPS